MPIVPVSSDCEPARPGPPADRLPADRLPADRLPADLVTLLAAAMLLLWPAWLNGYPLVFADTGTYLSQVVERHLGWDRPVFYALLTLPLHLTLTTWPVIVAQAVVTVLVLRTALRAFGGAARHLGPAVAALALLTGLPWVTSELMPDFATALLTIVLALLAVVPDRLGRRECWVLALLATALIAVHLSNLLLAPLLLAVLLPLRRRRGARAPLGAGGLLRAAGPVAAAALALSTVNLIGHGRFSPSPYGNVFALTRSLYDGPAMDALRRHCQAEGWRLCRLLREGLPPDSDDFLWRSSSPLYALGGPKSVSAEAAAILRAALREEPLAVLRGALRDFRRQLGMADTGDGLQPWPGQVTPVIHRDFPPAEARRYDAARQTMGHLRVPDWLLAAHRAALALGVLATLATLVAALRRRHPVAALCAATLLCLLGNAAITGALSGPHDRYQSRIAWLAGFTPLAAGLALNRGDRALRLNRSRGPAPADVAAPSAS